MNRLVNISKKNRLFGIVIKLLCYIMLTMISVWINVNVFFRKAGLGKKYKYLKKYMDIHKGERCFIICTGPSLTIEDLEKIKGEYTFSMNSICLLFDDTSFRPTYYGIVDNNVFQKISDKVQPYINEEITYFISDRIERNNKNTSNYNVIPYDFAYHAYDRWFTEKFWCKFSDDCSAIVYDMFSVTHSLIQMAVYMGFSEIYLLGADCNFPKGKKVHFKDYGVNDPTIDTTGDRNITGYLEVKKYTDAHGIKVYNATRGGALEVFERKSLEEVLAEN